MIVDIGSRIKFLRTQRDISQKELAISLKVSNSFLSALESGTKTPSLEMLNSICEALDISVSYFFETGKPNLSPEQEKLIANVKDLTDEQLSLLNQLIVSFKS